MNTTQLEALAKRIAKKYIAMETILLADCIVKGMYQAGSAGKTAHAIWFRIRFRNYDQSGRVTRGQACL